MEDVKQVSPTELTPLDAEYLAAVESGDMEAAQKMVDAAANAAGYTFRGARIGFYDKNGRAFQPSDGDLNFAQGYFMAEGAGVPSRDAWSVSKEINPLNVAEQDVLLEDVQQRSELVAAKASTPFLMAPKSKGGMTLTPEEQKLVEAEIKYQHTVNNAYKELGIRDAKPENYEYFKSSEAAFAKARNSEMVDASIWFTPMYFKKRTGSYRSDTGKIDPEDMAQGSSFFKKALYILMRDGRIKYDAVRGIGGRTSAGEMSSEFIVPNRNQIKSVETIVTDSKGNIIPLSRRFDFESDDVRLSSFSGLDTGATLDEEGQAQLLEILEQTVAQVIPSNVPVKLVSDITGTPLENDPEAAFKTTIVEEDGVGIPTMFINQANLESYLAETGGELFSPKLTKMLIESLLSEEFIHVAEFRTVSTEELDTIVNSLSDGTLAEIVSQYTAKSNNEGLRDRLNKGIAENDAIIKRQIVGEKLRMSAQKIMRGSTTEEDIAFYMGEPSFARILFRYLTNVFRKMYARYNLRKENPYMAAAINAMANELNLLRQGSFYQPTVSRFDVNNPNESLENLNQRLAATFAGDPDLEIDENTSLEDIFKRFSHLKVYEIADGVFEKKKYTPNKGLMRILNGETDRRVLELKLQSEAVSNGVTQKVISDAAIIMDLLEKNPDVTNDILADYLGRPDNLTPDDAVMEDLHNKHIRRIAIEKERRRRGETTEPIDYKALKNEYYDKPLEAYQKKVREGLIRKKDAAAAKIEKTKPKLYRALKNMRDHLDALSKVFSEQYDVNGNLKMVIDRNLGIYVTRQYRAFTEEGYLDKLLMVASGQESAGDAQMVEGYHRAHKYIESQFIRQFVRDKQSEERANNIPPNKRVAKLNLEEEGRIQLNSKTGQIQVREAITAYLQSLDTRYGSVNQVTKPAQGMTRAIFDQVRRRQDIPEPIRNLLGQYDESDVVNNVVRSIDAINRAASKQSFIKNLIQLGHQKDNPDAGFVFTQQELDTLRLEGKALPAPSMLNIRTGDPYAYKAEVAESIKDEVEQTYDIRAEYYIPSDAYTHIKNQFRPEPSVSSLSPDKQAVESAVGLVRSLTGISLAAKTLGSFGFYIRNVLGNALFFAPMNGMSPITAMKSMKALRRSFRLSPTRMKEITDYEAKLIAHNVLGGDITVGLIRDIVDSDFDPDAANKELNGLFDKLKAATKKAVDSKAGQRIKSQIVDRALLLSERVDAFYKIAYFEHEVKVYKKAVQWDKENGNVGGFASYSEYEIETEAAHNVRRTSQSYKDRYELVKGLSSKYGYLLAPFLGFKTDMLRITFDGVPKTIVRDIKSKNAVIRKRGYQRAVGLSTVAVGFGMVLPTALRMLYGIGEEEDENFRVTVPLYHKNATFLYYRDDEGTIIAFPFTFLLPLSDYAEPALRLTEHMMRGEFQEGLVKATGMFFSSYADDQIFAAAIKDAFVNKDDATGDPIYEEGEGFMIPAKIMRYIYENSFEPRTFKALRKAGMAAIGDEPTDPDKTAGAILAKEFYPVRGNKVDPVRATSTYLNHYRNLRNRLDSKLNKAKTRGSMTKGELEKITKDYVENRRAIDQKILSGLRSFEAFGLTPQMKRNVLNEKYLGIGKDRKANLARGLMRVPTLSSSFVEDMKSLGATGTERLRIMNKVLDRYPTLVTLKDD